MGRLHAEAVGCGARIQAQRVRRPLGPRPRSGRPRSLIVPDARVTGVTGSRPGRVLSWRRRAAG
jgi:hypothetical protein